MAGIGPVDGVETKEEDVGDGLRVRVEMRGGGLGVMEVPLGVLRGEVRRVGECGAGPGAGVVDFAVERFGAELLDWV